MTKNYKNRRGFGTVASILVVLAILVIGGGAYYLGNKNSTPSKTENSQTGSSNLPEVKNQGLETNLPSDWKTYRNDTYGFSIKYPSDWLASKGSWSEDGGFFYVGFGTSMTADSKPLATLKVYPNQTTLDKFVKYFDYLNGNWKDITLNNVAAKEIVSVGQNSKQIILVASVKNSYGYELASTAFGDNIDTVKKMSSTFKFLTVTPVSMQFNVFFFNEKLSPPTGYGIYIYNGPPIPVARSVSYTAAIATVAINELLKGPTAEEKAQGYTTNIPSQAKLLSLRIENGVAYADFNSQTQSGGSSNPQTILIEKTLLQFPTVNKVVLSVERQTENIFQP